MVSAKEAEFAEHLTALFACRECPNVVGAPVTGGVFGARLMLVGQAPGPHEVIDRRPFAYTAGRRLFSWFADELGVPETEFRQRVHIASVIRCFPGKEVKGGGDRVPDEQEITCCGRHLDREIELLAPRLFIAVGTLASIQLTGVGALKDAVGRSFRITRAARTFDVVVLPHPSGRSTWLNQAANQALLRQSLRLIGSHRAFCDAFGRGGGSSFVRPSDRRRQ